MQDFGSDRVKEVSKKSVFIFDDIKKKALPNGDTVFYSPNFFFYLLKDNKGSIIYYAYNSCRLNFVRFLREGFYLLDEMETKRVTGEKPIEKIAVAPNSLIVVPEEGDKLKVYYKPGRFKPEKDTLVYFGSKLFASTIPVDLLEKARKEGREPLLINLPTMGILSKDFNKILQEMLLGKTPDIGILDDKGVQYPSEDKEMYRKSFRLGESLLVGGDLFKEPFKEIYNAQVRYSPQVREAFYKEVGLLIRSDLKLYFEDADLRGFTQFLLRLTLQKKKLDSCGSSEYLK